MTLPPGFTLTKATDEDHDNGTISAVSIEAMKTDPGWICMVDDVYQVEKYMKWKVEHISPRSKMPDIDTYTIVEDASGKIVAWAALQNPWKHVPDMTPELKYKVMTGGPPPLAERMKHEVFIGLLGLSKEYGYDPEHDYHRRGTLVHPDFRRKGFATYLTQHCNEVADKTRDRTWIPAVPASVGMFWKMGFKDVTKRDAHLERWGGTRESSWRWLLLRDPPASK